MSLPALQDPLPDIPLDSESAFISNLFLYNSTTEAAIKAGYSESYATSAIRVRLKDPKFLNRIREYAQQHELVESVPQIMRLEQSALNYLRDKPQELPKFTGLLKQKKQIAGLLSQDVAPQQATISIGQVSNLMLNVNQHTLPVVNSSDNTANIIIVDDK